MTEAAFSSRILATMLAIGLLSFVGFALVLAFATGVHGEGQAHALSRSAVGYAGIVQLLQDTGRKVSLNRKATLPNDGNGLLVLTPAPGFGVPGVLPNARPVLIVLPKWRVSPNASHTGWVDRDGLLPPGTITKLLPDKWREFSIVRSKGTVIEGSDAPSAAAITSLQSIQGKDITAILSDPAGGIVLGKVGGDYVLAEPDLLNNQALATPAGAQAAMAIITGRETGPVVFDVSAYHPARSRNPLRSILQPPLLGATLCALAATVLTGLLCARRFGAVQRAPAPVAAGAQSLADNAAGLIQRARRVWRMGGPYATLTRTIAAREAGAPATLTGDALDQYLDQAGTMRGAPGLFTALATDARRAHNDGMMLAAAQRLYRWRMAFHGPRPS